VTLFQNFRIFSEDIYMDAAVGRSDESLAFTSHSCLYIDQEKRLPQKGSEKTTAVGGEKTPAAIGVVKAKRGGRWCGVGWFLYWVSTLLGRIWERIRWGFWYQKMYHSSWRVVVPIVFRFRHGMM